MSRVGYHHDEISDETYQNVPASVFNRLAQIGDKITSNPVIPDDGKPNNTVTNEAMRSPVFGSHIEPVHDSSIPVAMPGEIVYTRDANNHVNNRIQHHENGVPIINGHSISHGQVPANENTSWVDGTDEAGDQIIRADAKSKPNCDIDTQIKDVHSIQSGKNISNILIHIISHENVFTPHDTGILTNNTNVVMYSNDVPGFGPITSNNSRQFFQIETKNIHEDIDIINDGVEKRRPISQILCSLQNIHTTLEETTDISKELMKIKDHETFFFKNQNYDVLNQAVIDNLHSNIFIPHTDIIFNKRRDFDLIAIKDIRYPISAKQFDILTNPDLIFNRCVETKQVPFDRRNPIYSLKLSRLITTLKAEGFAFITIILSGGGRRDEFEVNNTYMNQFNYDPENKKVDHFEKIKKYTNDTKNEYDTFSNKSGYYSFGGKKKKTRKHNYRRHKYGSNTQKRGLRRRHHRRHTQKRKSRRCRRKYKPLNLTKSLS